MELNNLYLLPILVSIIIIFIHMIFSQRMKYDKRFNSNFSNRMYALSFLKPFVWFINPDESDPKVIKEEEQIKKAGYGNIVNYRSLVTFQVFIFMNLIIAYAILFIFMEQIVQVLDFIFQIESETQGQTTEAKIIIAVIFMTTLMIPKYVLKQKVKKNEYLFTQELPVVQLSMILMLRARRPMSEIIYTLGKNKTRYREIFEKAHRIHLRNKNESWEFLKEEFKGTGLDDTFEALSNMDTYSRTETIRVLENGMDFLVESSVEGKRSGAAIGNLFSQFSMAIPFGGLMLLGAVPFTMYIFDMMATQTVF